LHNEGETSSIACYGCLVGNNNRTENINVKFKKAYYTALARERYVQNKDVKYVNGELKNNLDVIEINYKLNAGMQGGNYKSPDIKEKDIEYNIRGYAEKVNTEGFVYWAGSDGNKYRSSDTTQDNYNYSDDSDSGTYGYDSDEIKDVYNQNESLTLTATYKVKIDYISNESDTHNMPGSTYGTTDRNITITNTIPTLTGRIFKGWSESLSAGTRVYTSEESISINENKTLYAIWEEIPYVTLNYNANTTDTVGNMPMMQTVEKGQEITIPNNEPTRSGYTFLGWATTPTATEIQYEKEDIITLDNDITLYAIWSDVRILNFERPYGNNALNSNIKSIDIYFVETSKNVVWTSDAIKAYNNYTYGGSIVSSIYYDYYKEKYFSHVCRDIATKHVTIDEPQDNQYYTIQLEEASRYEYAIIKVSYKNSYDGIFNLWNDWKCNEYDKVFYQGKYDNIRRPNGTQFSPWYNGVVYKIN